MLLATASRSGVKVLTSSSEDPSTLNALGKAFRAHAGVVSAVEWHRAHLVSAGHDGSVAVCTPLGAPVSKLVPMATARTPLACVAATSTLVLAGAADGAVHLWKNTSNDDDDSVSQFVALPSLLSGGTGAVSALALGAERDNVVACARASGGVTLHRIGNSDDVNVVSSVSDVVCNAVKFSIAVPRLLAAGSVAGDLLLWNDASDAGAFASTPPARLTACHRAALTGLAFSPANRQLLCSGGLDRRLVFVDVEQRSVVREISAAASLSAVAFRADGYTVAAGTSTGSVLIYDLRGTTDAPLAKLATHSPFACHALAFRSTVDDSALIADLQAAAPVVTPVGTGAPVTAVTTAAARRVVAIGSTATVASTSGVAAAVAAAPTAATIVKSSTTVAPSVLPIAPRTAIAVRTTKAAAAAATTTTTSAAPSAALSPARTPAAAPQAPPTVRTVRISLKHNEVIGVPRNDRDDDGDDEHSPIGTPLGAALVTPVAPRTGNDAAAEQSAPATAELLNRRLLETPPTRRSDIDDEGMRAAVEEARQLLHRDMVDLHHAMIQNFSQLFDAQVVALRTLQQQNNVLLGEVVALRAQVQHLTTNQQRQPRKQKSNLEIENRL
jgi:hypothetical protein